jgi:plasmid stabilization system protein ParE
MFEVVILPIAKRDIQEAALWYDKRKKGLGKKFTASIRQKMNLLKTHPFSTSIRYDEIRTAVLDIFPYMMHYSVDESKKIILISAVLHTSRNPDIWGKDRKESDN